MKRLLCAAFLLSFTILACADDAEPIGQMPDEGTLIVMDMSQPARDVGGEPLDAMPDSAGDMGSLDMADLATDLPDAMDSAQDTGDLPADMAFDMVADMPGDMSPDMTSDMSINGVPLAGFGVLTGDCQQIDTELADAGPSSFRNTLDFEMDPYGAEDLMALTAGGQAIIAAGNAGGNSLLSEVFAFEVLARCESATLLETETTIDYLNERGKITDLLVEIDGERVGVSVVRAFAFPFEDPYPESEARRILEKKLGDILISSENVKPNHAWVKQILSVIAYTPQHADQIEAVYLTLDPAIKSDTIVYITATEGEDRPIYNN